MTAANGANASSSSSIVTDQTVPDGEEARQGAAGNADLLIDVFDVIAGGLARNHQTLCDFGVGQSQSQEPQDLDLARSEAGRQASAAGDMLARRTQDRIDRTAVESARIRLGSKVNRRILRGVRGPMRSWLQPGPVGVGRRENPTGGRQRVTDQPARITRTVQSLVMLDGKRAQRGESR